MELIPIIGLEIHVQLKTKTKMFCSCSNYSEDLDPNTAICPVCLGHPGTLPVVNEKAIEFALKAALAMNCEIAKDSKFDRKNYFYPDLPKGYQISQFDKPIAVNGYLEILNNERKKTFRLTRIHLEEDAAKLMHSQNGDFSLVDFNRGGTPLIEIVTEPDFRSQEDARIFLQELRMLMRYLNISDADMEKGHLRCDANISMRPKEMSALFPKTEIKNLNSFKAVEKALNYEIKRQIKLWEKDDYPKISTTRGWNDKEQITEEQRTKEESDDYRYFPEPDIPAFTIEQNQIENVKNMLPELPMEKRARFLDQYKMEISVINQLIENIELSKYCERVISELNDWIYSVDIYKGNEEEVWKNEKEKIIKLLTSWLLNKLPSALEKRSSTFEEMDITPENFAELITLIYKGALNSSAALTILENMIGSKSDPSHLMEEMGLAQIDNQAEIDAIIENVIKNNPKQVTEYKTGKEPIIKYLVGQVMKESKGKANPQIALELLKEKLK